jgi:hypothetical protein
MTATPIHDPTPADLPRAPVCAPCAERPDGRCCGTGECWLCPLNQIAADSGVPFQQRVDPWLLACFGEAIARDTGERNHRFLEEALELAQANGCTASEAYQLVDYTFGRPIGEAAQEVGGVMVTLAALCLARGIDMHAAAETELARIWTMVEKIRTKQAAKPKHSPLPEHAAPAAPLRLLAAQPAPARDVVPGKVRCAKCGFVLLRTNLYMGNGTTGPGSEETEPCPNDGTPLLPVSWEHEAREAWAMAEQQFDRAKALEVALVELVACKDLKGEEARRRQRRECSSMRRPNPALDEVNAMRDDYNRRKPLAWAAARALLPKVSSHG